MSNRLRWGVATLALGGVFDERHEAEASTDHARTRLHNAEQLLDAAIKQAESEAGT